jgi:hypothetical protein
MSFECDNCEGEGTIRFPSGASEVCVECNGSGRISLLMKIIDWISFCYYSGIRYPLWLLKYKITGRV